MCVILSSGSQADIIRNNGLQDGHKYLYITNHFDILFVDLPIFILELKAKQGFWHVIFCKKEYTHLDIDVYLPFPSWIFMLGSTH